MSSNKMDYITASVPYCKTHNFKVPFCMPEFPSSKIILHCFCGNKNEGELGIGYDVIIFRDLMVKLDFLVEFKQQVLQWDVATAPMKEPRCLLGQTGLISCKMRKVVMQTEEPVSKREDNEGVVKNINSTYAKADLEEVAANATQMNA